MLKATILARLIFIHLLLSLKEADDDLAGRTNDGNDDHYVLALLPSNNEQPPLQSSSLENYKYFSFDDCN